MGRACKADDKEQQNGSNKGVSEGLLTKLRPELYPSLVDETYDTEEYKLTNIAVGIDYHSLRVHQDFSVYIVHVVGLEGDKGKRYPANYKTGKQEPLFLFGVGVKVLENLECGKEHQAAFGKAHQHVLRRMDPWGRNNHPPSRWPCPQVKCGCPESRGGRRRRTV